jgi:hypothetical protein
MKVSCLLPVWFGFRRFCFSFLRLLSDHCGPYRIYLTLFVGVGVGGELYTALSRNLAPVKVFIARRFQTGQAQELIFLRS